MPTPFSVRDQDRPGVDLGQWDESGNITIPGTLSATGLTSPAGTVIFAALVAAFTAATAGTDIITSKVAGDATNRFVLDADGTLSWGGGATATDISIGRYAAGGLEVSGALRFTNGQLLFGTVGDVNLYRGAGTEELKTDDNLNVVGTISTTGTVTTTGAASTTNVLDVLVLNDTFDRYRMQASGRMDWGPGNGARDTNLYRSGVGLLATDNSLVLAAAGGGVQVKEGTNATMGVTAAMTAGTITVSTTKVTANSRIFLTAQTTGAAPGALRVSARTAGTSFTITSTSGTDTSTVAWWLVEPAA